MNFGALLAGGIGSRMNLNNLPKQFFDLNGTPIIVRTLKAMIDSNLFDKFIIAVHRDWKNYCYDVLKKNDVPVDSVSLIDGGNERIDSIENVLNEVLSENCSPDDILLLHDAVRPFVSAEILSNSILEAKKVGACVAVVPAIDTMYVLNEQKFIDAIPHRKTMFHGQSPDTFKVGVLKQAMRSLTEDERKQITGTVQICFAKNIPVGTVQGSYKNIKITTPADLSIAQALLQKG